MLISSIVRLTLGIKDHRVVSTILGNNELEIHLDAKRGRRLPCAVCGRPCRAKDKIRCATSLIMTAFLIKIR